EGRWPRSCDGPSAGEREAALLHHRLHVRRRLCPKGSRTPRLAVSLTSGTCAAGVTLLVCAGRRQHNKPEHSDVYRPACPSGAAKAVLTEGWLCLDPRFNGALAFWSCDRPGRYSIPTSAPITTVVASHRHAREHSRSRTLVDPSRRRPNHRKGIHRFA